MNTLRAFHQNSNPRSPTPQSSKSFKFSDGGQLTSVKAATIPATIGSCKVEIKTDIIDSHIPLALSKAATKKAEIVLNFNNDTITFQGHQIKLNITSNDIYYLPITKFTHQHYHQDQQPISNNTQSHSC